jgi:tRNA pseudouridine38-40 synthase
VDYVAARVAYDGTLFHGFQIQRAEPTVQAALEEALFACTGQRIRVIGSGRTDAGVHANGQVVAAQVAWKHSVESLQKAWNAHLPRSITVRDLVEAPDDFHPRFSAERRTYRYTLVDWGLGVNRASGPKVSPLTDRFALYVTHALDIKAMQAAANRLVGQHDFATFGQPPQGENTVRIIYDAQWQVVTTDLPPLNDYPGRWVTFTVTANAFLRQMVRNLVGTLLAVGRQLWPVEYMDELLATGDRGRCAPPAPPQGLVLEHVSYPKAVDPWHRNALQALNLFESKL